MAGLIEGYNLTNWFDSTFSPEEKAYMESKYGDSLYKDTAHKINCSSASFLSNLLSWFYKKDYSSLCIKIAEKAEEQLNEGNEPYIDLHFYYTNLIRFYYKLRANEKYLNKAILYCKKSIEIAPIVKSCFLKQYDSLPTHVGYEQLAIIYKNKKDWQKVIDLCKKGKSENWGCEFDKRIIEAEKHLQQSN